ncbi:MAG: hypothetical protein RLZZ156_487 [Deinococcota bacterium]|jgi:hypothetical protein
MQAYELIDGIPTLLEQGGKPKAIVIAETDDGNIQTRFMGYGIAPSESDQKRKDLSPLFFETIQRIPKRKKIILERYRTLPEALFGHSTHVRKNSIE